MTPEQATQYLTILNSLIAAFAASLALLNRLMLFQIKTKQSRLLDEVLDYVDAHTESK